jgi:hypothetical protein
MTTGVLSLEALRSYARCSLAWFWETQAQVAAEVPDDQLLLEDALRAAIKRRYAGEATSLNEVLQAVWVAWSTTWGDPLLAQDLLTYARKRSAILDRVGRDAREFGGLGVPAQHTARFKTLAHDQGLRALGQRLDDFGIQRGALRPATERERHQALSRLGEAYSQARAAAHQMESAKIPLPAPVAVQGLDIAFLTRLTPTLAISGVADLVAVSPDHPDHVVLEIHDFEPEPGPKASRDLRVLAALLAGPDPSVPDSSRLQWAHVDAVILRQWRSGTVSLVRESNPGYLAQLLATLARGITDQVVVPRALLGQAACGTCGYLDRCWSADGWRELPLVDPGLLDPGRARSNRVPVQP